jgi:hypothetical protein
MLILNKKGPIETKVERPSFWGLLAPRALPNLWGKFLPKFDLKK